MILSKEVIGFLGLEEDVIDVTVQDGALFVRKATTRDVQARMRAAGKQYEKTLMRPA